MIFSRFSPVLFLFAPDDGANANGAPTGSTNTNTSASSDTSASDGINTAPPAEGADAQSAANPHQTDTQADPTADSPSDKDAQNGFKPIASQEELDRIVKDRLERQKSSLKAEQKQQKLEAEGKWEDLYKETKGSFESEKSALETKIADLEKQLAGREQSAHIERAILNHKLDKDAAELFRDSVEGKELDTKALEDRAKKFAKVVAAPVAPATEGGAQNAASAAQAAKQDHYSFNPQGGVKW